MFFSYTVSVLLLSLALYGMACVCIDLWQWWLEPKLLPAVKCSFLVVVRDVDEELEYLLRNMIREVEEAEVECDIVVANGSCNDLTAAILSRFEDSNPIIRVVTIPSNIRPINEAMALCRGEVVHVLDLSSRLDADKLMSVVAYVLHRNSYDALTMNRRDY